LKPPDPNADSIHTCCSCTQLWERLSADNATASGLWRLGLRQLSNSEVARHLRLLPSKLPPGMMSQSRHLKHLEFLSCMLPSLKQALGDDLGSFPVLAASSSGCSGSRSRSSSSSGGGGSAVDSSDEEGVGEEEAVSVLKPLELLPARLLMLPLPKGCEDLQSDVLKGGERIVHEVSDLLYLNSVIHAGPSSD
jgi:hypothetical protein